MQIAIVTLFPELFAPFFATSLMGRASESGVVSVHYEDLRQHGLGKHLSVDDTPYGGGSGMVMRPDCTVAAMDAACAALGPGEPVHRILLTPQGKRFTQADARRLAEKSRLCLTCGRYEGFDERVRSFVDEELSLGDCRASSAKFSGDKSSKREALASAYLRIADSGQNQLRVKDCRLCGLRTNYHC